MGKPGRVYGVSVEGEIWGEVKGVGGNVEKGVEKCVGM